MRSVPKRGIILALLVSLGFITFLDRLCIAVAGPKMQAELGIPPEQWGWILGAFVLAYGLFEIPTGALGDRWGQRSVLMRVVVWWSAFTCLTGAVSSFPALLVTRFLFGAGEAGAYPNISGSIARWFPPTERARVQGYVWAASRMGGAIAPLLVVPIQQAYGWRAAFFVFGAVGLVWAAAWWHWYRDSPTAAAPVHVDVPWRALFRQRQLWLIIVMYWFYAWGSWFYFSWLHTYLVRGRGFTMSEMALFSTLPFVMGALGNVAGGFLSDACTRRFGARHGRRMVSCASLATGAVLILLTASATSKTSVVLLLTFGFGIMDLMLPSAWAVCLDIGGKYAGVVAGAMNTAGQLGGFACTVLFGYIVGATGNYNAPLYVIAAMVAVSAVLFAGIDASRPLPGNE